MSRTVTAALDDRPRGHVAARWAAREAERRGLPLRLVHVMRTRTYADLPLPESESRHEIAAALLRGVADDLRDRHPGLQVRAEEITGDPGFVLAAVSAESELLVLGTRGMRAVTGFLVGSVSLSVAAHARCPVVLVRERTPVGEEVEAKDVVLGLDLARPSDALIAFAFEAANRRRARLRVVHGFTTPSLQNANTEAIDVTRAEELGVGQARALADALRPWRGTYPDVEIVEDAVPGRPVHRLAEASAGAALVVVGRRTRRGPVGARLGSVAHAVLHHSEAPVAVVPHD
ncbi:universal stress protein [Streptomyces sp. B6B3]|uniref:universal stress protein n=1 Tax=Streptomyces sp. B6B3 TaxID=3153570 RepID=UPI00325CEA62